MNEELQPGEKWRRGEWQMATRHGKVVVHNDGTPMLSNGWVSPSARWGLRRTGTGYHVTHIPSGLALPALADDFDGNPLPLRDIRSRCAKADAALGAILPTERDPSTHESRVQICSILNDSVMAAICDE